MAAVLSAACAGAESRPRALQEANRGAPSAHVKLEKQIAEPQGVARGDQGFEPAVATSTDAQTQDGAACAPTTEVWPRPGKYTRTHTVEMPPGTAVAIDTGQVSLDARCARQLHLVTLSYLGTRCEETFPFLELTGERFVAGFDYCRIEFVRRGRGFEALSDFPVGCAAEEFCGQGGEILGRAFDP